MTLAPRVLLSAGGTAWPPDRWRDVTGLIAVSGGADSVALARALAALYQEGSGRLLLAHFNHRLRGDESDADQAFVQQLAEQLRLEFLTEAAPAPSLSDTPSLASEGALRDLRYKF